VVVVKCSPAQERASVRFPQRLTQDDAVQVLAHWRLELVGVAAPVVEVDASALQQFDSSAVAVLLELRRHLLREGRSLQIKAGSQRLRDLMKMYGVAELLSV